MTDELQDVRTNAPELEPVADEPEAAPPAATPEIVHRRENCTGKPMARTITAYGRGVLVSYLQCSECHARSERVEAPLKKKP